MKQRVVAIPGTGRLVALVAGALLVRLPLVMLTPGYDVRDYKIWARVVHEVGMGGGYGVVYPSPAPWYNYPPLYLYLLRGTAALYALLRPRGDWQEQFLAALLKLGPVAAELALGVLLYGFLRRRVSGRMALAGATAYLFNPALVWNTAYWGGIDSLHALFLTAALLATASGRPARAWSLATLAVGAKLLAVPGVLATIPPILRTTPLRRLVWAAGAALCTGLLLSAPIIAAGDGLVMVRAMLRNVGNYPVVSVNAHNIWWLVTAGHGATYPDTATLVPGVDYRTLGLLLFAATATWALTHSWRTAGAGDVATTCSTGAFLTYAFFLLTTEVHENWGVALFGPLVVTAVLAAPYRPLYGALTLATLVNLGVHDPPLRDLLGPDVTELASALGLLNAAAGCILFGWWILLLRRGSAAGDVRDYHA